jgi:hypothetical protein
VVFPTFVALMTISSKEMFLLMFVVSVGSDAIAWQKDAIRMAVVIVKTLFILFLFCKNQT